jgi:predicted unusual protein kinase regulating ubiquinone biosynthesis (AarF/ABC1/UbiB family)
MVFYDFFKQLIFIINFFYIITSEISLYFIFKDYSNFIYRITSRLASINILYVKIFQSIASNNSLIDETTNYELIKFTDKAPWSNYDIQFEELIDIADTYELTFTDGFEKPINSGMISLVYKGIRKRDQKPFIIKMKRKNIEKRLNDAIDNLKLFLYLISYIPVIHKYKISEVVNKNIEIIRHQTNFNEEVNNINRIRNNCKNLKYVKIPEVYPEATKQYPDFIMMEYIDGKKISEILEEDYYDFSKQVLKFGIVTTIVHGLAHGDLHSGNILFIKDEADEKYKYKVGVIDFGILYEIDDKFKEELFDFLTQIFERETKDSVIFLLNSGFIEPRNIIQQIPKKYYDSIIEYGVEILDDTIKNSNTNQLQLYKFLSVLNTYFTTPELSNFGIRPSDNLVKMQLVLAMAHGITLTLGKGRLVDITDEVLNELFHKNVLF